MYRVFGRLGVFPPNYLKYRENVPIAIEGNQIPYNFYLKRFFIRRSVKHTINKNRGKTRAFSRTQYH